MERTPSSKEAPHTKPSAGSNLNLKDTFCNQRARLAAAFAAILAAAPAAGCGGEPMQEETPDAGTPAPVPVCETPERADAPAPRVTVQTDNVQLQENRLRIGFDVPAFDEECRAPFTVHARAMVWRNPEEVPLGEEPSGEPLSSQEQLPGETVVYEPGAYSLDAEFPPHAARLSSVTLHLVDAAGQEYVTPPFSPLE